MLTNLQLQEIEYCKNILLSGKTLLYPTDTVWGIGCDASNESAVDKIYKIKGRSEQKPLLVLVSSIEMIKQYQNNLSTKEIELLTSSQPTTVILNNVVGLANNISLGGKGIGFRIANHPLCKKLIEASKTPLTSTSANLSGEPFAKSRKDISLKLLKACDYLVEHFEAMANQPSRIVQVIDEKIIIIRK